MMNNTSIAKTALLAPGESQTVTIKVDNYSLASFCEKSSAWVSDSGSYTVLFGFNVEDIKAQGVYKLKKAQSWPVHDVLHIDEK